MECQVKFRQNLELQEILNDTTLKAFHETGCVVILGDGCGLNYLTTNPAIAEELKKQNKAWEEEVR